MISVAYGEKYSDKLKKPLLEKGFNSVLFPNNENVAKQVCGHIDMSLFAVNEKILVCEPSVLAPVEVIKGDTHLMQDYPCNIAYNGVRFGNNFFHNLRYTDKKILEILGENNVKLHNVRQGYTKCSVLKIDERTAITSDVGIKRALDNASIDTLLIQPGGILLEGYDTGFIGGCGFSYKNTVYLTGRLEQHPSFGKIADFLNKKFMQVDYLTDIKIFDVGSIIPIFWNPYKNYWFQQFNVIKLKY